MEADAKRLQGKEEELLRRKETLRNRLAQLRKERRDLRAAIEANTGRRSGHHWPGSQAWREVDHPQVHFGSHVSVQAALLGVQRHCWQARGVGWHG